MNRLLLPCSIALVLAATAAGCSKKECGPATAPDYASNFVLAGGKVCKASDGGGGVTLSINYESLDEAALQDKYKQELTAKGYKFTGKDGTYFASKGAGTPSMIVTLKDKDRGGATAVVKTFPEK